MNQQFLNLVVARKHAIAAAAALGLTLDQHADMLTSILCTALR